MSHVHLVGCKPGQSLTGDPAVNTVCSQDSMSQGKRYVFPSEIAHGNRHRGPIVGMEARHPSEPQLLFRRLPTEGQPGPARKHAPADLIQHEDHERGLVDEALKETGLGQKGRKGSVGHEAWPVLVLRVAPVVHKTESICRPNTDKLDFLSTVGAEL